MTTQQVQLNLRNLNYLRIDNLKILTLCIERFFKNKFSNGYQNMYLILIGMCVDARRPIKFMWLEA